MGTQNSKPWKILYTDPMWAINQDNALDAGRAAVEREVYGKDGEIEFGQYDGQSFVPEGNRFNELLTSADAVVIYRTQITPGIVEVLRTKCKVVGRQGVGIDNLNASLLKQAGIYAFNVSDYCVEEVSTHTLSMMLALERGLCFQNDQLKQGRWGIFLGGTPRRLSELTLGIIGFGRIGRATARKAEVFYDRILAYDPFVHEDLMHGYGVKKCHQLSRLMEQSDVVVLHCSLNEDTRHIIDRETISHMREDALLINTARGGLVEPEAVLHALQHQRIGGYGSDVFTPEDPNADLVNKQILGFNNVVVTSHRAFLSKHAEISQRLRVAQQVRHVLATGSPPESDRLA
jgi:phosphoglycerate dehydrogenase-like enzyme